MKLLLSLFAALCASSHAHAHAARLRERQQVRMQRSHYAAPVAPGAKPTLLRLRGGGVAPGLGAAATSGVKPSNLRQFLFKLVCAAASWYRDPARFRQSVWPYAACELTYWGMRVYFAHGRPGGDTFAQPEGPVLSLGPIPKAVSTLLKLALLAQTVASPCWYVFPKLVAKFDLPQQARLKGVGVALCTLGLALQFLSHLYLGTNWSTNVETQVSQKLCVRGVYSQVRHPMYTAFLAFAVGALFLTANWLVGLSYITLIAVIVFSRITPEEDMMAARFGQEYDTYRARTGALVPPQAGARVATTVLCCAAVWYVLAGLFCVATAGLLQESDISPLFTLISCFPPLLPLLFSV